MALYEILGNLGLAAWIFSLLTQSAIIFLIGWGLAKAARGFAPPLKSGILLTLIVLLIILPLGTLVVSTGRGPLYKLPVSSAVRDLGTGPDEGGRPGAGQAAAALQTGPDRSPSPPGEPAARGRLGLSDLGSINPVLILLNGFALIWLAGVALALARLVYGLVFLSGFRSSLVEIHEDELSGALEAVKAAFPNMRPPAVYLSPAVDSPVALGILRPMIVLPQSLANHLSAEELVNILIHETAHIRHFDQVSGLLQRLLTSIYWWNPLAYALSASFSVTREDVSDNYAIRTSGARSYANCLVALARKTSLLTRLPAAVGMATPYMSLEDRVKNIMSKERVMTTKMKKPLVVLLAFSAVLLVTVVGRYSWTLTAADDAGKAFALPSGLEPFGLAVDKDRIYVCESKNFRSNNPESQIAVHSAADFSMLTKIGQAGKGAGQFILGPGRFRVFNGQIWAEDLKKYIIFSRDGVFQKEIPIPREIFTAFYTVVPVGENLVTMAGDWPDFSKGIDRLFGRLYDSNLRKIREFYEEIPIVTPPPPPPPPPPLRPGQKPDAKADETPRVKKDYQAIPDCIDFAVADNKIFVADTRKGFHIAVFDSMGTPLYEINKDNVPLPVPPEYRAALMNKLQATQGWLNQVANIKFRDAFPAFYSFGIADGKIYVSTYAEKDGLYELIVMDLKGDILKRSFSFPLGPGYDSLYSNFNVARDRYAISGGKLFYLAKNAKSGTSEVRIQDLK